MIVNDVAGFIGPEVFRTGDQLLRACLEDTVMAKLHGLTMGLDVCSTFHMGIEPRELQQLSERIVEQAAPTYLMAVAGNADPMLGYLTTSFREHPRLRKHDGKQISTAMQRRLDALSATDTESLYAAYMKAGGDTRSFEALRKEAARKIKKLQERGYDLGYGHGEDFAAPAEIEQRMNRIYAHARRALYALLAEGVIRDVSPRHLRVRTKATDREDYLSHPPSGERIRDEDAARLAALYAARRPEAQIAISDGLNANALNENLRALLPALRHELAQVGTDSGETDVIVANGRVRAGYHIGSLLGVDVMIHLIGERPGTGLNTMSAYLTYGRDAAGLSRWSVDLDHSCTTAICGIHRLGKQPEAAATEIARSVKQIFEARCSGVALRDERG